jgi:tRNA-Thr(GGU) m(6)t(6)A37 methyltransferase TsaA
VKLFRGREPFQRSDPPETITLEPIGRIHNRVARPRPRGWETVESRIELKPEHTARAAGLEEYSHLIVIFYMDLAEAAPELPEQLKLASGRTYGIFATRSQLRPNHLGVSVVALLGVERAGSAVTVTVRGLDAIEGTPVLDLKPYLPEYDSVPSATLPGG